MRRLPAVETLGSCTVIVTDNHARIFTLKNLCDTLPDNLKGLIVTARRQGITQFLILCIIIRIPVLIAHTLDQFSTHAITFYR